MTLFLSTPLGLLKEDPRLNKVMRTLFFTVEGSFAPFGDSLQKKPDNSIIKFCKHMCVYNARNAEEV